MQFFTMAATSDLCVVVMRDRRELKRLILRETAGSAAKKAGVTCRSGGKTIYIVDADQ